MFIHGHNFFGKEINLTYGPTAAEYVATDCEIFVRHEIVRCLSDEGTGHKHLFRITIDSLSSILYAGEYGYGQPVLNDVAGAGARNALSSGGEPVRLMGKNFGAMSSPTLVRATYKYIDSFENITYRAQECVRTKDHEEITCFTEPGAGHDLKWTVYVDGQASTAPYSTFLRPTVSPLAGSFSVTTGDFRVGFDEDSYKQRKQLCYLLDLLSGEISLFSKEQILVLLEFCLQCPYLMGRLELSILHSRALSHESSAISLYQALKNAFLKMVGLYCLTYRIIIESN